MKARPQPTESLAHVAMRAGVIKRPSALWPAPKSGAVRHAIRMIERSRLFRSNRGPRWS